MSYTVFNQNKFNFLEQPMFFGEPVSVARFDQQRHRKFEALTDKQLSFFWRAEEIPVSKDAQDFRNLPEHEKHIFISNLKYQTLLDSVQGRSPVAVLLPLVSDPALENWIETWAFSETIHSRSYTHIIRNVFENPSEILDDITNNKYIMERATAVTKYYDDLYDVVCRLGLGQQVSDEEKWTKLYKCLHSINALEAIRFYVSFACSFAFGERKLMKGNADIIQLISRDESLHLSGTQYMILEIMKGSEGQVAKDIAMSLQTDVEQIFIDAVEQEKQWAKYLFQDGSMLGLNEQILCQYVEYLADQRMRAVNLNSPFNVGKNPLPWMSSWLNSSHVQATPQEKNLTSYLSGQVDTNINIESLSKLKL